MGDVPYVLCSLSDADNWSGRFRGWEVQVPENGKTCFWRRYFITVFLTIV